MIAPLTRIIARYLAGAMVAYGLMAPQDAVALHPDLVAIVGAVLGGVVESAYAYARRRGWAT